jgi:hypothetical protein
MSGVRDKPEMPGRSSALEQNLRIGRSGVAIVLAAHDKDWAIHCRKSDRSDAIAKAKRQSGDAIASKREAQTSGRLARDNFRPIVRCDFDCRIDRLKNERINF